MYVDKTELVYRLANINKTYFLSRPCRFGKSLLVSTLEAYFQGKKELFEGSPFGVTRQTEKRDAEIFQPIIKALGQYLRFLFLTGISKFSQMSIFSELNNLQNISMNDDYSAICGITETELHTHLNLIR